PIASPDVAKHPKKDSSNEHGFCKRHARGNETDPGSEAHAGNARHSKNSAGGAESEPATKRAAEARAIKGPVIDLTAEAVEPEVTNVPEGGASLAPGLSLPPSAGVWARRMGEMVPAHGDIGLPSFNLEALKVARPSKIVDVPDGAQFLSRSFACAAGSRPAPSFATKAGRRSWKTGYTDPSGPDASREMLRFFFENSGDRRS
ncbi:MAG TPA: hypothetical protein VI075_01405, partial [Methyloceanibacter sp.]